MATAASNPTVPRSMILCQRTAADHTVVLQLQISKSNCSQLKESL